MFLCFSSCVHLKASDVGVSGWLYDHGSEALRSSVHDARDGRVAGMGRSCPLAPVEA